jgi:hypothetical protein
MLNSINISEFVQLMFDQEDLAEKEGSIIEAILESRSPRLSDISPRMRGNSEASYKAIQRFLRCPGRKVHPFYNRVLVAYSVVQSWPPNYGQKGRL